MAAEDRRSSPDSAGSRVHAEETEAQRAIRSFPPMDVALVRWPTEADRRTRLQQLGTPRLLLVEEGQPPPPPEDCLEDWIRVPADDRDVRHRMEGLAFRSDHHAEEEPDLDPDGVIRFASAWVSLPPVEARLTRALVDRFGAVVGREALAKAGWPDGAPGRNALDVHVLRLRRRLTTVGLSIKTVRSRGYLLEAAAPAAAAVREA